MKRPPMVPHCRTVLMLLLALGFVPSASAQYDRSAPAPTHAASSDDAPSSLTGKERLGRKWMDEQRIDNCNVPLNKRGAKPRPVSCAPVTQGTAAK
jgi:hypothetical protein